jgi:uncharacterized phage-associated protein
MTAEEIAILVNMKKVASVRKILQALSYIQNNAPHDNENRFNILYLLKMVFFCDRYHLRHFGITATYDDYFAMKLGPVASRTFDILKNNPINLNSAEVSYLSAVKGVSEYEVLVEFKGEDELSESSKKALNFALKEFGHYDWKDLSRISHCYPEWKKHESQLSIANRRIPMDLRDFFSDPEDEACFINFNKNEDPFREEDKEFLALLRDDIGPSNFTA